MNFEKSTSSADGDKLGVRQLSTGELQRTQSSVEHSHKLQTINDILDVFDFSDKKEIEYREFLLEQDNQFLVEALNKSKNDRLRFLLQSQNNILEQRNAPDFVKLNELQKQLISLENQEQKKQQVTLAGEKVETLNITKTDKKIAELKMLLLENKIIANNPKLKVFQDLFNELSAVDRENEVGKRKILQRMINKLNSPGILESIAKDLGGAESNDYLAFKSQLLAFSPSLKASFDRVEMSMVSSLAKIKLGTDDLTGVELEGDTLIKVDGNLKIEASKNHRNLSLVGSDYKLPSKLDSKYKDQIEGLNQKSMKELALYDKELTLLSGILNFLKTAQENGVRFEEAKTHIQQKHPETYNTLGLSGKNSFNELMNTIHAHMAQLTESKKKITKKTIQKLKRIAAQNKKEAERKDRATEEMLRFFNEIGLDIINQDTFTQIISMVNLNPHSYGLQQPIDFENSSLGFDFDFGNNSMSLLEKKAFIGFVNKMLGEDIINEDIANGITSLQPESVSRLRVLNNKTIGYFIANLNMGQS